MNDSVHNPDVLSCLANLSNDEVFTPPTVVNQMLDMLPKELFQSSKTTFLDIGCKSGVFLREIAKRLIVGLANEIPDLQTRVDHILHNQLYGIATTELTSLVSRRTLYCSKYPNCRYSTSKFNTAEGNIRFRNVPHEFVNGRCKWCGASEDQFGEAKRKGLETHAYEFIHTNHPEEIFNMKFDVIVGNPPYQMSDGGGVGSSAIPLYDKFILAALRLRPRYVTMIVPSRWFAGGKGLDDFRNCMLKDRHIRHISDFFNAEDCFPGVDISGGVCYFLWSRDNEGDCEIVSCNNNSISTMVRPLLERKCDTFIRFNQAVPIVRKVTKLNEESFQCVVSARRPFGIKINTKSFTCKGQGMVRVYAYPENGFISKEGITQNTDWISKNKIFISKAYGERGDFPYFVIGRPFIGEAESCCMETYLVIGVGKQMFELENICKYMRTKFFRFLILMKKNTQNASRGVYGLVPMQDFSKPWTDAELYKKYKLTKDEIAFIESMIKPME